MKTLTELKADAYDLLAAIEELQRRLQQVNTLIINYKEPAAEQSAQG